MRSFAHIFSPYADKYHLTLEEVSKAYNAGTITEPGLDAFFDHDRAVRESGHDTSNRVEGLAADLATVDLNCLLYRYETDISFTLKTFLEDSLVVPAEFCASGQEQRVESSLAWSQRAERRKLMINKYLWNEDAGMYFDYNTVTKQQSTYETVTGLWPMWCHVASEHQAAKLVSRGIPRFECQGGLSSTSEQTRGIVSAANPQKQWDYPQGWAPHQILAWDGLSNYGYHEEAEKLTYRWLHMIVEIFKNYNGTVVEKYDVTRLRDGHKVDAEYGNQGLGFKYAPSEG